MHCILKGEYFKQKLEIRNKYFTIHSHSILQLLPLSPWEYVLDENDILIPHLQRNDQILLRFDKVNSEKEKLKNDIMELRAIR